MLPISVCIIAKNEERNIGKCLTSLTPYFNDIVVLDTGSSDQTKIIASSFPVRIYDFPWQNDFSLARNYCASKSNYDWVLVLDCDETLESIDVASLNSQIRSFPKSGGSIKMKNETRQKLIYENRLIRLYPKKYYHYVGQIHEQVAPSSNMEYTQFLTTITLYHTGYALNEEDTLLKNQRNLNLLLDALVKNPDDSYTNFQIGQSYKAIDQKNLALPYYERALQEELNPQKDYSLLLLVSYGNCLLDLNLHEKALVLTHYQDSFGHFADYTYLLGRIYLANTLIMQAMASFVKATTMRNENTQGVTTFLSYYHLGIINEALGDTKNAITFFKLCKDYGPAKDKLKLYES